MSALPVPWRSSALHIDDLLSMSRRSVSHSMTGAVVWRCCTRSVGRICCVCYLQSDVVPSQACKLRCTRGFYSKHSWIETRGLLYWFEQTCNNREYTEGSVWDASTVKHKYSWLFVGFRGHAVAQWLRHWPTNRNVAGSIPDGVNWIFHPHNTSGRTMALGSTQPLTEISTRNICWG
jgi:hypothetical protein